MVALEAYAVFVRLLPCVFLFWLAWIVGRSSLPNASGRWLSAFFAIVASGFLVHFLALLPADGGPIWAFLALDSLLGVTDPPVLLAFSLAVLGSKWLRAPWLWMAYIVSGPVVSYFSIPRGGIVPVPAAWGTIVYVNATYLACFTLLLRAYLYEPYRFRERQLYFVLLAVGFAAFSRSGAIFFSGLRTANSGLAFVLPSLALAVALLLLFWAASRTLALAAVRRPHAVFASLLALLAGFAVAYYFIVLLDELLGFSYTLRAQYFELRWLVVGGILGYGIVRHQIFDFGLRTRQAGAFLVALVVGLVAAFAAAVQSQAAGASLDGARLAGLACGIVGSLAAYHGVAWAWKRHGRGAELPIGFRQRRLELYEAALEFSLADRDWTVAERLFADTLRDAFEITPEEHEQVLASLRNAPPKASAVAGQPVLGGRG